MTTLILICGLPGSGKTTLAKQLELTHSAIRFSPDEWITYLLKDATDIEELDRLRSPVEAIQWDVTKRLLAKEVSVILEWGFWSEAERTYYRTEAEAIGAEVILHYLDVAPDELWRRLEKRNKNLPPDTFTVTKDQLDLWLSWFETPTHEELTGQISKRND